MAGLPWIKLDATLTSHPKTIHLAELLGGDDAAAIAGLVRLWLWASQSAPTGIVRGAAAEAIIERGAGWTGERGAFVKALVASGYLDELDGATAVTHRGYGLHNWTVKQGAHIEKAASDRARMRKQRKTVREQPANGSATVLDGPGKTETEIETKTEIDRIDTKAPPFSKTLLGFIRAVQAQAGLTSHPTEPLDAEIDAELSRVGATEATEYVADLVRVRATKGDSPRHWWPFLLAVLRGLPAQAPSKPRDKQRDEKEAVRVLAQALRDLHSSLPEADARSLSAEIEAADALEDWGEVQTQRAAVLAKWRKAAA